MYIGLDLGTSGLKAILMDDGQKILAEATAPLTVQRPHEGWSKQNPAEWTAACETVLSKLSAHGLAKVRAIGLSGHMHGATLVDAAGGAWHKLSVRALLADQRFMTIGA